MKSKPPQPSQEVQSLAQEYLRLRAREAEVSQQKNLTETIRQKRLEGLHLQKKNLYRQLKKNHVARSQIAEVAHAEISPFISVREVASTLQRVEAAVKTKPKPAPSKISKKIAIEAKPKKIDLEKQLLRSQDEITANILGVEGKNLKIVHHKNESPAHGKKAEAALKEISQQYEAKLAEEQADAKRRDQKSAQASDLLELDRIMSTTDVNPERKYQEKRPLITSFERLIDSAAKLYPFRSGNTK